MLILGVSSIIVGVVCLAGWLVFRDSYERGVRRQFKNRAHAEAQLKIAPWIMLFFVAVGVTEIVASVL